MSTTTDIPQRVQDWDSDLRVLLPHVGAIVGHDGMAARLFPSKREAFDIGVAVGSTLKDTELRGLEAVQAEKNANHAETLRWIERLNNGKES